MSRKAPFFGKINLFWCNSCRSTLLGSNCPQCGKIANQVIVAPPGDIRPAFSGDWKKILATVATYFGKDAVEALKPFSKALVLLNKSPHVDRQDEIIINGKTVGIMKYDLVKENYILVPKPELAKLLVKATCTGIIELKPGTSVMLMKKSSILIPGIKEMDTHIKKGDPVIICEESKVIATGVASIDGKEFFGKTRGKAAKIKYLANIPLVDLIPENFDRFIENNRNFIARKQKEAIFFIKKTAARFNGKILVSYSGGKDSLVTCYLVFLALGNEFELIFVDTGFEFEETLKNVQNFSHFILQGDMKRFHWKQVDESYFWNMVIKFGPPARDLRYCCKKSKLAPVNQLLEDICPKQNVLTFLGRRKYESQERSFEPKVSRNRWIPKQKNAAPIKDWNALEIYLFIWIHHLEKFLNPLYQAGLIRVGCWLCPASNMADIQIVKNIEPEKYRKLIDNLEIWREKQGLPFEWIKLGLWRWKTFPQKINRYLERCGITIRMNKDENIERMGFESFNILTPCKQERSFVLQTSKQLDLARIKRFLPLAGQKIPSLSQNLVKIASREKNNGTECRISIHESGVIKIRSTSNDHLYSVVENIMAMIVRSHECTGCQVCVSHCNADLISFDEEGILIAESCTNCGRCSKFCPIMKYFYQDSVKKVNMILNQKL
ncbi:MAG: phosphoadenosine phosphosulfate reductase family protein [Candidatus Odinarchaeota archaeon]